MLSARTNLSRRVAAALDATPSRIPVVLGGCGSGRTTLLQQVRDRIGRTAAQYVDVERIATTPERFLRALLAWSPFPGGDAPRGGARDAFVRSLAFLTGARAAAGEPATFLLDEFLEFRTFESFPGLRQVAQELLDGLAASGNRLVLTSRYTTRVLRLLRDRSARFEVIHMPLLTAEETSEMLGATPRHEDQHDADYTARTVNALGDGRPSYVRAIGDELSAMHDHGPGGADALSALAALMSRGGRLAERCHSSYELRLHRARGYGALKAILDILAEQEGLTLTEISQQLQRTPGSTKDYLSWLEDVDLVVSRQKRYSFADPLLRVWVRLHCRAVAPTDDDIAREVHLYALPRLPQPEPALAMVAADGGRSEDDRKPWGIIEID